MSESGGPGADDPVADMVDDEGERPWYEQPASYAAAAGLGVIAIIIIIVIAVSRGDDGSTSASTTAPASTTTVPEDEANCRSGDAAACEELDGRTLGEVCDDEIEVACAELFRRLGEQSAPTTVPAPSAEAASDADLCTSGDAAACSRLSDVSIDGLCGAGVDAACQEADVRFEAGQFDTPFGQCQSGDPTACAQLGSAELAEICPEPLSDPGSTACLELEARGND